MNARNIIVWIAVFISAAALSGCGGPENYGKPISDRSVVPIKNILMRPQDYDGKDVSVKGNIAAECPTGCWFDLKDKGAVIYVDVEPSGFAIPQKVGAAVTVEGEVVVKDGKPAIIGKGVKIE